eukprot:6458993-Amphidinium_carterae.3
MHTKLEGLSQETPAAASHCESMAVIVRDRMEAITAMVSPTMDALKGYIKKFESSFGDDTKKVTVSPPCRSYASLQNIGSMLSKIELFDGVTTKEELDAQVKNLLGDIKLAAAIGTGGKDVLSQLGKVPEALKSYHDNQKKREVEGGNVQGGPVKRARKVLQGRDPIFEHGASHATEIVVVDAGGPIDSMLPALIPASHVNTDADYIPLKELPNDALEKFRSQLKEEHKVSLKSADAPRHAKALVLKDRPRVLK